MIETLKDWARMIKRDVLMLWFARRHPQTPMLAKILSVLTVAYALSPIDLIPDFVPVLGYLDDLLIVPGLIWLTVRLLPPIVIEDSRKQAQAWIDSRAARPRSYLGAAMIVVVWLGLAGLVWFGYFAA